MYAISTPLRALALVAPICAAYTAASALGWGSSRVALIAGDVGLSLAYLAAGVSCLLRARTRSGRARLTWTLIGCAALASTGGNLVWAWYEVVLNRRVPDPSLADAFFLWYPLLLIAGFLVLARFPRGGVSVLCLFLDAWLVAGTLFSLAWSFALIRLVPEAGGNLLDLAVLLAYPVMGIFIITVLAGLQFRAPPQDRPALGLVVLGLAVIAVADALWTLPTLHSSFRSGGLLDAAWFSGAVVLAVAPWVDASDRVVTTRRAISLLGVLTPYLAAAASGTAVVAGILTGNPLDPVVLLIGGSVIIALLIRQGVTLLDNVALNRELAAREDHFRSLVQGSSDVIMIATEQGQLRYLSPAVEQVFGYQPDELVGSQLRLIIHPEDAAEFMAELREFVDSGAPSTRIDCRVRGADGTWRHTESTVSRHPEGLIFNSRDVSDRVALQEQLTYFAFHDTLTGLPNRALFADRVTHALEQRGIDKRPIAVLFLDLDGFKAVNDSVGHAAGDELLIQAARRLRSVIRAGDTAARFGGDEFAVLLESDATPKVARDVAERLLAALSEPYRVGGVEVVVAASIGIAFSAPGTSTEELMRNADLAMYRAKANGKGRVEVYEPSMHTDVVRRVELEAQLRRALRERRFTLLYQPVVDLSSGRITDVEALIRWRDEGGALVTPAEFIRLAEDSGRIVQLGRWVIQEAVRQATRWHRAGHRIGVAVNLSARQVATPGLIEGVQAALEGCGLPPEALTLEITESVLLDGVESTVSRLRAVKEYGVRLAIDDFGTGYSSLAYLCRLPVDLLKIDRAFIEGLGRDDDHAINCGKLAAAIIRLGRDLDLELVVEGIERPEQLALLRDMGCQRGQGFLFSGPLDAAGVQTLLDRGPIPLRRGGVDTPSAPTLVP
ncbi:phosphodiesterase [Carbonactinospora thermoautotrophica]|uniref:putative bifunctional diguanylate cyclase/phosphodiesterase n=1 Tax=Carbonactinospora thermoautotrophica TaxID=1469144 RepID=UPI00226DFD32|nr:EAL domain-containing protein [Carbonactinospora thermoautotrophica]MCX9191822.1 phosphodiesterase [Carbonactinospora thermoautotrophica]